MSFSRVSVTDDDNNNNSSTSHCHQEERNVDTATWNTLILGETTPSRRMDRVELNEDQIRCLTLPISRTFPSESHCSIKIIFNRDVIQCSNQTIHHVYHRLNELKACHDHTFMLNVLQENKQPISLTVKRQEERLLLLWIHRDGPLILLKKSLITENAVNGIAVTRRDYVYIDWSNDIRLRVELKDREDVNCIGNNNKQ